MVIKLWDIQESNIDARPIPIPLPVCVSKCKRTLALESNLLFSFLFQVKMSYVMRAILVCLYYYAWNPNFHPTNWNMFNQTIKTTKRSLISIESPTISLSSRYSSSLNFSFDYSIIELRTIWILQWKNIEKCCTHVFAKLSLCFLCDICLICVV